MINSWGRAHTPPAVDVHLVDGPEVSTLASKVASAPAVALAAICDGEDLAQDHARVAALGFADGPTFVLDLWRTAARSVFQLLTRTTIVGHNLKRSLGLLGTSFSEEPQHLFDTALAARLVEGGEHATDEDFFTLPAVLHRYLGLEERAEDLPLRWQGYLSARHLQYAGLQVRDLLALHVRLRRELEQADLMDTADLEFSLIGAVTTMEIAGLPLDEGLLSTLVEGRSKEAERLGQRLQKKLGVKNLESDSEVLAALHRQGLDVAGTGAEHLSRLSHIPFIKNVLRYRALKSFVDGIGTDILVAASRHEDARVRCPYSQLGTSTGRFSACKPNLLGVPRDPEVRSCFVAPPGNVFVGADYSCLELRIVAAVAGENNLLDLFRRGGDPHLLTAARMYNKRPDEVTANERKSAKPVNYGVIYKAGAEGLVKKAQRDYGLRFTLEDAKRFRTAFLEAYPRIGEWQDKMASETTAHVRTLGGRLRYLDHPANLPVRLAAIIQGTSTDGFKRGLVRMHRELRQYDARIILVPHDGVLVEAPEQHADEVQAVVETVMVEEMEGVVPGVPFAVKTKTGRSWAEVEC